MGFGLLTDFHGVVANLDRTKAALQLKNAPDLLMEPQEVLDRFFYSNPLYREIDTGILSYEEMLHQIAPNVWQGQLTDWVQLWENIWECYEPSSEIQELLADCRDNHVPVLLITDNHRTFRKWLTHHRVFAPLATSMLCSGEIGVTKPDKEIFVRAVRELGVPFTSCIYIDDNPDNINAGKRLGMRSFLFTSESAAFITAQVREILRGEN